LNPSTRSRSVVDTDVVSFLFRQDTRAALYRRHLDGRLLLVSFMTVAELDQWAEQRRWGPDRRQKLEAYLATFTVLPSNRDLCRWWARIRVACRDVGRPIEVADAWIAATAMLYGVPLVTHNPADYTAVAGLQIITEAPSRKFV
jgi:tRNA(fMet)-specific endonuclease VapC